MNWTKKHIIYLMVLKKESLWKYSQCFMRRPRMLASWIYSFLMWVLLQVFRSCRMLRLISQ
ncbi:hypothetical protein HMPREF9057_00677 [Actinomyces sp. oral taxon 171 str. F0337]|nr:hypothetical protein HMPREF9057_00677 [Actinomyces sp. oral taxon 171 str. F0337]